MKKLPFVIPLLTIALLSGCTSENSTDQNEKETVEINETIYLENHKEAIYTTKEIADKCPVGTSFNDYRSEILSSVTVAETYTLNNKNIYEILIAKNGFVGVESDGNKILNVQTFFTFQEAVDYLKDKQ